MNPGYDNLSMKKAAPDDVIDPDGKQEGAFEDGGGSGQSGYNFINNLVFCRDPTVLEDKQLCMSMRSLI